MGRLKKAIKNIIILTILCFLFFKTSGLYLTPISAHEYSERSIHYGPSEVVHIEDWDGGKYILCKYDKWVSCNTVKRTLLLFWRFGNQPIGFENDKTKAVDYTWGASGQYWKLYGIINDDKIKKVEITIDNGEVLTQTAFYDDLFLFTWKSPENDSVYNVNIRGYDADNNVIFEEER